MRRTSKGREPRSATFVVGATKRPFLLFARPSAESAWSGGNPQLDTPRYAMKGSLSLRYPVRECMSRDEPSSPRPQMGTNALVAWNCSTEQARTVAFAMPILRRASRVVVLTVEGGAAVPGPTGQQLCQYLQLSGVPAKPLTVGLNGRLTGEAVLDHANALGCDLLIKGAYTQSRLRQFIFGGTTRYILSNATLPVLLAH